MWGYGLYRAGSGYGEVAGTVNAVMQSRVPCSGGISLLAENRLASQEGFCCME